MQHLPIGIQNFEDLRRKNFKYVDKTSIAYQLAESGKYYFAFSSSGVLRSVERGPA